MYYITHRIHGARIYANIWGILMVNVTIYSIHGSYGYVLYYIICWFIVAAWIAFWGADG
jgi:hypothetical protein